MQILSKRKQKEHIKKIEDEIAAYEKAGGDMNDELNLSTAARIYKEKGVVQEQWETAGAKIEYVKSKLERAGWHVPGPLNLDDEEEANVDQDDLNSKEGANL